VKQLFAVVSVLFILTMGQTAFGAGPGYGVCPADETGYGYRSGYGQGQTSPLTTLQNICSGSPETITGAVTGDWMPGAGLTVLTEGGAQTVFGLGPIWYWEANSMDRPEIGESVSAVVSGVTVAEVKVILAITIDGQTLQLRDPLTCLPVWRGKRSL